MLSDKALECSILHFLYIESMRESLFVIFFYDI